MKICLHRGRYLTSTFNNQPMYGHSDYLNMWPYLSSYYQHRLSMIRRQLIHDWGDCRLASSFTFTNVFTDYISRLCSCSLSLYHVTCYFTEMSILYCSCRSHGYISWYQWNLCAAPEHQLLILNTFQPDYSLELDRLAFHSSALVLKPGGLVGVAVFL